MADEIEKLKAEAENNFSAKQELAISLFGQGKTWNEVSEIVGISLPTISRWRNTLPGFKEKVRMLQMQNNSVILANLEDSMCAAENKAIIYLTSLLEDDGAKTSDRINAAKALLSHQNSRKAHEDGQVIVAFEDAPLPGVPLEAESDVE